MNEISKIGKQLVKSVSTGESVALETLWSNSTCVVAFLRRFGCVLCRQSAQQLSTMKPQLDAQGVKLVGIGLEEFGVEEFVEGNYFNGDLYIDTKQSCYQALEYRRYSWLGILPAVLTSACRELLGQAKQAGVSGNLKGDGLQMGGCLVISKGGEQILYNFRQEVLSDHPSAKDILAALGIQPAESATDVSPNPATKKDETNVSPAKEEAKN